MAVDPLPITLCISTRNAAEGLAGCIESAREWVREIVIVDMESSDETIDIARSYGAKIVQVPAAGWAEPGRQSGIDAATQPWVLVLDADERAGAGLAAVAHEFVERDEVSGVRIARQNFQFGWWLPGAGIWPDWQLRLFKRERTTWSGTRTHVGPSVEGTVAQAPADVEAAIVHHSFPTIGDWVRGANSYTDLEAQRMSDAGRRASIPRLLGVPAARFVDSYLRRRGYRGGRYGLAVALMSFCYWLLAELKLWERTLALKAPTRSAVRESPDA
jgi:(heptosyl)LPS beta-1,4-glucosyltransferase